METRYLCSFETSLPLEAINDDDDDDDDAENVSSDSSSETSSTVTAAVALRSFPFVILAFLLLFSLVIFDRLLGKNNVINSLHYVSIHQLLTRSGPIGARLEMELVAIAKL